MWQVNCAQIPLLLRHHNLGNGFIYNSNYRSWIQEISELVINMPSYEQLSQINKVDIVGLLAAICTILAFYNKSMKTTRIYAISANVLFIIYGIISLLYPILLLHLILFPINIFRLLELINIEYQATKAIRQNIA